MTTSPYRRWSSCPAGAETDDGQPLTALRATILDLQVYPLVDGARDEIVVGAAGHLREEDLLRAIQRGGGVDVHVWRTTVLALVDGQTKAPTLAARVANRVAQIAEAALITPALFTTPPAGSTRRGEGQPLPRRG